MSTTIPVPTPSVAPESVGVARAGPYAAARANARVWPWERLGLVLILALSGVLELWHLDQLGTSNSFYAAAVLSMIQNWHAFFFNSLDSAGFVTIDKPPLGFWVQALSAKILGFSGFSILLPEALATIACVALVYSLVKRAFGGAAGLLAALVLAVVPVSVVVGRNNTIDALLVFDLLLAVWTCLHATERGSLKWLLATGALVGLGFEIKMLEAYLVVPALGLVYLLAAPVSRRRRIVHLSAAACVMLAISLAWPLAVDLTPANLRPFVDSTQDNSAISLALGYNGLQRLVGQNRSIAQFLSGLGLTPGSAGSATPDGTGAGGLGSMFNNGPAGIFRLFDQQLAGQASWLLPMSLVGMAFGLWQVIRDRANLARSRQAQAAVVWGTWLIVAGGFFSVANFFHSYYLVTLGPPVAALAAMGVWNAWRAFRSGSRMAWILPAALAGTALLQAHILADYPSWSRWLTPIALGGAALGGAALVVVLIRGRFGRRSQPDALLARTGLAIAMAALVMAPSAWSVYSSQYGSNNFGGLPSAGPALANGRGGPAGFTGGPPSTQRGGFGGGGSDVGISSALTTYLEQNRGSATYLEATMNSKSAASIILATNDPVMSLGGFSGRDPILSVDQFAALVKSGQLRYVLLGGGGGGPGPGGQGSGGAISQWVQANGTLVPATQIGGSQTQLYDLGSLQTVAA